MNIRTRLTLLFALLVASIMLFFSLAIYYLYNSYRETEFFARIMDKAQTTVKLWEDVGDVTAHQIERNDLTVLYAGHVNIYANNRIVYNSSDQPIPISSSFLERVRSGHEIKLRQDDVELIGFTFPDRREGHHGQTLVVVASAIDKYGFSKLAWLRQILVVAWLASLGIVVLAGWLFAGDALKPVSDITDQVNAISATNIHARLRVGRQNDELAKLAATFNEMLSRLEEAFINQKSFVSHASHELRTPLTVMMGQVDVALMQPRSSSEYQHTLEGVLEEGRKMNNLVNGLLELARVNADVSTLTFGPVRVDELLWQARGFVVSKDPAYQIDIEYQSLPEREEDLMMPGEESLLRTAFQNLIENGCKYSPNHRVEIGLLAESDKIHLTFTDHGYGIPPQDVPHIFEPFFRSENTVGIIGHGIGLALTHRIITLHQGQIDVSSVVGQGTTFRITFSQQPMATASSQAYSFDVTA